MTFYMDFDSAFRDRTTNPNPGLFTIPVATITSPSTIQDPVANSTPLLAWSGGWFKENAQIGFTGTVKLASSGGSIVELTIGAGVIRLDDDYYNGATLQLAGNIYKRIIRYKNLTPDRGLFYLDSVVPALIANTPATIQDPSAFDYITFMQIFVPRGVAIENYYAGMMMYNETNLDQRLITGYSAQTRIAYVDTPGNPAAAWLSTDNYSIRMQLPSLVSAIVGLSTSQLSITSGADIPASIMRNSFVRMLQPSYGTFSNLNLEPRQIVVYDPLTLTATVSPPFPEIPVGSAEILAISHDNATTFVNNKISKAGAWSFSLVSLSIPKVSIIGSIGGDMQNYPYIYVQLINTITPAKYTLVSNNPSAVLTQFRATLTSNNNSGFFYKLSGDGTEQKVQIDPSYSLIMSIVLPDGTIWTPFIPDTTSPSPPNPLLRISASFSCRPIAQPQYGGQSSTRLSDYV